MTTPTPSPSRKDRKGVRPQRKRATKEVPGFGGYGTCTQRIYYEEHHPQTCPICIEIEKTKQRWRER